MKTLVRIAMRNYLTSLYKGGYFIKKSRYRSIIGEFINAEA